MYTLLCAIIKGRRSAGGPPKKGRPRQFRRFPANLRRGAGQVPCLWRTFLSSRCQRAPLRPSRVGVPSVSVLLRRSTFFLCFFLALIFLLLGSCFSAVFISEPFLPSLFPSLSIRGLIFSAAAAPSIFSWGRGRERGPLGELREVRGTASGPARTHNSFLCALNDAKRAPGASSSRHLPPSRRTQQCALTIRSRRAVRAERS